MLYVGLFAAIVGVWNQRVGVIAIRHTNLQNLYVFTVYQVTVYFESVALSNEV